MLGNNATIRRVDIRDVGWSAVQLYNDATGVNVSDVFVDYAGPGVWDSRYTSARGAGLWLAQSHDVTIERVRIESHVLLGVNVHWDTGNPDPFLNTTPPRNYNITISDLYSRAYKIGVHFDLGVEDAVVHFVSVRARVDGRRPRQQQVRAGVPGRPTRARPVESATPTPEIPHAHVGNL